MHDRELYIIADVRIEIQSDLNFPITLGRYEEYCSTDKESDYIVKVIRTRSTEEISSKLKNILYASPWSHFYLDSSGTTWELFFYDNLYYAALEMHENHSVLYHLGGNLILDMVDRYRYNPITLLAVENILIRFNTILLHSCHIKYGGKSILFTAPSGVGKSTQGALWEKYLGAEVINGDRTAIRRKEGVWLSYGVPMCGTSGIHLNKKVELGAIIILEQAEANRIIELPPWEKFKRLYSQTHVYPWKQDFVREVICIVEKLVSEIPIYLYQCTKEPEAAYELRLFLEGKGVFDEQKK